MKKTNITNTNMTADNKRNIRVRIIAVALSAVAAFSAIGIFAGCNAGPAKVKAKTVAAETKETKEKESISGGYTDTKSPVLTDKDKDLFKRATESLTGVTYTPVAYLGTQVVAGTNHLFLCKTAPVVPGATETYALVKIYEDLNGNASVTEVQNCEAKAPVTPDDGGMIAGGETEAKTPEATPDAKAALDKACKGLDGAKYEIRALLETQVVAGTNYTLLCKITPVVPNAASHYAVVKVYEKPDGSAEISETFDFTSGNNA